MTTTCDRQVYFSDSLYNYNETLVCSHWSSLQLRRGRLRAAIDTAPAMALRRRIVLILSMHGGRTTRSPGLCFNAANNASGQRTLGMACG
jgi:hypothetical protein